MERAREEPSRESKNWTQKVCIQISWMLPTLGAIIERESSYREWQLISVWAFLVCSCVPKFCAADQTTSWTVMCHEHRKPQCDTLKKKTTWWIRVQGKRLKMRSLCWIGTVIISHKAFNNKCRERAFWSTTHCLGWYKKRHTPMPQSAVNLPRKATGQPTKLRINTLTLAETCSSFLVLYK